MSDELLLAPSNLVDQLAFADKLYRLAQIGLVGVLPEFGFMQAHDRVATVCDAVIRRAIHPAYERLEGSGCTAEVAAAAVALCLAKVAGDFISTLEPTQLALVHDLVAGAFSKASGIYAERPQAKAAEGA